MKSQGDIARVGVDAAAIEVGRRSEILLNDAQYPVLIGPLLLLRLFNSFAPLRRKAVQGKPLTVEDRTLLGEESWVLVYELRQCQAIFQGVRREARKGAQVTERVHGILLAFSRQAMRREHATNAPGRLHQVCQVCRRLLRGLLHILRGRPKHLKDSEKRKARALLRDASRKLHTHRCPRLDGTAKDGLGALLAHEKQQHTAYQVAQKVARCFFVLSPHAVGFLQGMLLDKVALLVVLGKGVQDTLGRFLCRLSIPDERQFAGRDDTQRWNLSHDAPQLLDMLVIEWNPSSNAGWQTIE